MSRLLLVEKLRCRGSLFRVILPRGIYFGVKSFCERKFSVSDKKRRTVYFEMDEV